MSSVHANNVLVEKDRYIRERNGNMYFFVRKSINRVSINFFNSSIEIKGLIHRTITLDQDSVLPLMKTGSKSVN